MQKCCCLSLRMGGNLMGIFQIVGFLLAAVFWMVFLYAILPVADKELSDDTRIFKVTKNSTLQEVGMSNNISIFNRQQLLDYLFPNVEKSSRKEILRTIRKDRKELRNFERLYKRLIPAVLLYCLIGIIFASLLLHGIRKESLMLLKTWLIYQVISIAHGICFFVGYYIYMGVKVDEHFALYMQFVVVSPTVGVLGLKIIYDLRNQIKRKKNLVAIALKFSEKISM